MAYYKIKNITNSLAKRDANKDKTLNISYNVGFIQKNYSLPVANEMIISCANLPVNIQSLRLKHFITVREISENEFLKNQRPNARKQETAAPKKVTPIKKTAKKVTPEKKAIKKVVEETK